MSQYTQPEPHKTFAKLWERNRLDFILSLNQFQDPPNPKLYQALIRNIISIDKIVNKNIGQMQADPLPNTDN